MTQGYYLVEIGEDGEPEFDDNGFPIVSGSFVELPPGRWGRVFDIDRTSIRLVTEHGRRYIDPSFERETREMTFRTFSDADRAALQTLDQAVGGDRDPFLFVYDYAESPLGTLFVRKESNYRRGEMTIPTSDRQSIQDYTMTISEEPTGQIEVES